MGESTEHASECMSLADAWHLAWLYDSAVWIEAHDAIRHDLAEIAAGATVH